MHARTHIRTGSGHHAARVFVVWIPNVHVRKLGTYCVATHKYHRVMWGRKFYYRGLQRAGTVTVVYIFEF